MSESTEAFDRGDKFAESFGCGFASPKPFREADYQEITSLREYVLISTKRKRVDCFRRGEQGLWVLQSYRPDGTSFRLNSVDFEGKIAGLYEDVTLG